jgi:hypothetical protein
MITETIFSLVEKILAEWSNNILPAKEAASVYPAVAQMDWINL